MDKFEHGRTMRLSEFREDPARAMRKAGRHPLAVVGANNRVVFYAVDPVLFDAIFEEFEELELQAAVMSRLRERAHPVEVDIDTV